MINSSGSCEHKCGSILKIFAIVLACAGIGCSFFAANDCRFWYTESETLDAIGVDTTGTTTAATTTAAAAATTTTVVDNTPTGTWIGIFKHETIPTTTYYDDNNEEEPGGAQQQQQQQQQECSYYETVLDFGGAPNAALLASQLCAVLAPGLAALAIIVSTVELLCRRFLGSFVLASVLFLTASTVQSGTFGILLIDPDLCLDHIHDDHDGIGCSVGKAAYIGASASFCYYFCACILFCCSPRPVPWLQQSPSFDSRKCREL